MSDYESFAQHGEDHFVAEHFGWRTDGFFVEVGALDGVTYSNTLLLERELGWRGILIEANPEQASMCTKARKNSVVIDKAVSSPDNVGLRVPFTVVDGFEALSAVQITSWGEGIVSRSNEAGNDLAYRTVEVECTTIDAILEQAGAPADFEFMSIDIEGHEEEALRGFSLGTRWRPSVLLIENALPWPDRRLVRQLEAGDYVYRGTIAKINEWWEPRNSRSRLASRSRHYWDLRVPSSRALAKSVLQRAHLLEPAKRLLSSTKA